MMVDEIVCQGMVCFEQSMIVESVVGSMFGVGRIVVVVVVVGVGRMIEDIEVDIVGDIEVADMIDKEGL